MLGYSVYRTESEAESKTAQCNLVKREDCIIVFIRNCPNCGAPIDGDKCEYCGTVFDNISLDYNQILNHQYEQLKQVQRSLEVQFAMEELSNHIKEQQLKTCHEILQTKNSPLTYLRKPRFRFGKKKDYESKNWK